MMRNKSAVLLVAILLPKLLLARHSAPLKKIGGVMCVGGLVSAAVLEFGRRLEHKKGSSRRAVNVLRGLRNGALIFASVGAGIAIAGLITDAPEPESSKKSTSKKSGADRHLSPRPISSPQTAPLATHTTPPTGSNIPTKSSPRLKPPSAPDLTPTHKTSPVRHTTPPTVPSTPTKSSPKPKPPSTPDTTPTHKTSPARHTTPPTVPSIGTKSPPTPKPSSKNARDTSPYSASGGSIPIKVEPPQAHPTTTQATVESTPAPPPDVPSLNLSGRPKSPTEYVYETPAPRERTPRDEVGRLTRRLNDLETARKWLENDLKKTTKDNRSRETLKNVIKAAKDQEETAKAAIEKLKQKQAKEARTAHPETPCYAWMSPPNHGDQEEWTDTDDDSIVVEFPPAVTGSHIGAFQSEARGADGSSETPEVYTLLQVPPPW